MDGKQSDTHTHTHTLNLRLCYDNKSLCMHIQGNHEIFQSAQEEGMHSDYGSEYEATQACTEVRLLL